MLAHDERHAVLLPTPISAGSLDAALPPDVIKLAHPSRAFSGGGREGGARLPEAARSSQNRCANCQSSKSVTRQARQTSAAVACTFERGVDIAVVSEAGCPAIADPGATLVAAAHRNGWRVQPLVGPSSIISGADGKRVERSALSFVGYLPMPRETRGSDPRAGKRIERRDADFYRDTVSKRCLFEALLQHCRPTTRLAVAADLTGAAEFVRQCTVEKWRRLHDAAAGARLAGQATCGVLLLA